MKSRAGEDSRKSTILNIIIRAVEACNVQAFALAPVLGIQPDRLNNNGVRELIELSLTQDEATWSAERVLDYLEVQGHDSGLGDALTDLRDFVEKCM